MTEIKSIAVIGIGLIGGSVLKGLKSKNYKLFGVSRRHETIDNALKENIICEGSVDIGLACEADLIFVCTPVNKTIETINTLRDKIKPETIVTDVASLKTEILDFANNSEPFKFIGGHPMAGTENKGLEASSGNLFEGAKWVLTPSKWADTNDLEKLCSILEILGAKVIFADACQHDKAAALISHMPLLLSQALFGMTKNYPESDISKLAMNIAASGFRDMTRLAATNPELAKDMLFQNKKNVLESVQELKHYLEILEKELSANDENFIKLIEELALERKKMYSSDGKNIL